MKFNMSESNYHQHIESNAHQQRCLKNETTDSKSAGYCHLCKRNCGPHVANLRQHEKGKEHRARLSITLKSSTNEDVILKISPPPPPAPVTASRRRRDSVDLDASFSSS
jgi:hypothetical protein